MHDVRAYDSYLAAIIQTEFALFSRQEAAKQIRSKKKNEVENVGGRSWVGAYVGLATYVTLTTSIGPSLGSAHIARRLFLVTVGEHVLYAAEKTSRRRFVQQS